MLVLSRKIGESILIGENVVVTVREMRGGRIRLAIEAPQEVLVLRNELIGKRPSRREWDDPVVAPRTANAR
jgi:carbon storage regulator